MPIFDPFSNSAAVQGSAMLNMSDTDGVSLPGGFRLSVTSFNQALGAELLTNGNFAAWTGDNPDGWTVTGESGADPQVTQTAPDGSAGTGAATFESSATASQPRISQSVMSAAAWYEFGVDITARTSGGVRIADSSFGGINSATISSVRTIKRTFQSSDANATISALGAAPHDFTIDNATLKQITPNSRVAAVANGTFDFFFTQPGTTYAQIMIGLIFRAVDASNYQIAYLSRKIDDSGWDLFRARVANNAAAVNTAMGVGVGTPTGIRVVANGDSLTFYTFASGTYTQRGSVVTDANFASATGVSTIYSPGTTPLELLAVA